MFLFLFLFLSTFFPCLKTQMAALARLRAGRTLGAPRPPILPSPRPPQTDQGGSAPNTPIITLIDNVPIAETMRMHIGVPVDPFGLTAADLVRKLLEQVAYVIHFYVALVMLPRFRADGVARPRFHFRDRNYRYMADGILKQTPVDVRGPPRDLYFPENAEQFATAAETHDVADLLRHVRKFVTPQGNPADMRQVRGKWAYAETTRMDADWILRIATFFRHRNYLCAVELGPTGGGDQGVALAMLRRLISAVSRLMDGLVLLNNPAQEIPTEHPSHKLALSLVRAALNHKHNVSELIELAQRYCGPRSTKPEHTVFLLNALLKDTVSDAESDLLSYTFSSRLNVNWPSRPAEPESIDRSTNSHALDPTQAVKARVTVTYHMLHRNGAVDKQEFTAHDPTSATHADILNRGLDLLVLGLRSLLQVIAAVVDGVNAGTIQDEDGLDAARTWMQHVLLYVPNREFQQRSYQFSPTDTRKIILWASNPVAEKIDPPLPAVADVEDADMRHALPTVADIVAPGAAEIGEMTKAENGFINDPFFMLRNLKAFLGLANIRQRLTDDVVEPARQATETLMDLRDMLWHHVAFLTAIDERNAFILRTEDTVRHLVRMRFVFTFMRQHFCPANFQDQPSTSPAVESARQRLLTVDTMFNEFRALFVTQVPVPVRGNEVLHTTPYHHRISRLRTRERLVISEEPAAAQRLVAMDRETRHRMRAVRTLIRDIAHGRTVSTAQTGAVINVVTELARLYNVQIIPKSKAASSTQPRNASNRWNILYISDNDNDSDESEDAT